MSPPTTALDIGSTSVTLSATPLAWVTPRSGKNPLAALGSVGPRGKKRSQPSFEKAPFDGSAGQLEGTPVDDHRVGTAAETSEKVATGGVIEMVALKLAYRGQTVQQR